MKGSNCLVEMYSAIGAEVEIKADPSTCLNQNLLNHLKSADKLIICGQELSHCVNYTTRDIVNNWEGDFSKICVLKDACSPVAGFEEAGNIFLQDMSAAGVTITTCAEVFNK
jgi:nicotinamidase-related amidase